MKKILFIASLISISNLLSAQTFSFEHYNLGTQKVNVSQNNKEIANPFAGGFNVPQFNEFDLNYDGKLDLLVFDRDGYRLSTYINNGTAGVISYVHAPQYEKLFPEFTDWILTVDYNGDGKRDIFASIPGGAKIYKNVGNATAGVLLQETYNELNADYGTFFTRLNVNQSDYPAILDVDDDGDIDILTFSPSLDSSGEGVYWFKNMGVERFGKADTMDFIVAKQCWGRFRESFTNCNINLNYPIGICASGGRFAPSFSKQQLEDFQKGTGGAHAGSTLTIFDANGDGKKDILIGDLSCTKMVMLLNTNTNQEPIMTQAIKEYPSTHPIEMFTFPTGFLVDVNNDGVKDLVVAPNISGNSDNTDNTQLYLNTGSNDINQFVFSTNSFLEADMIEVGMGSSPAFVDVNGDNLQDIVISNTGYFDSLGVYTTGLGLYQNNGTASLPSYQLVSRDWQGFSTLNIANMAPDFSDMDGDGDKDMVCGSSDGTLHYFTNNAASGSPMNLQYVPNYFAGIDVGSMSTPFAYDFNGDGKKEVIVGERFDNINLFENTGTLNAPTFVLKTDSLWKINTRRTFGYPSGRSKVIVAQVKSDEPPRVVLSNGNGKIYLMNLFNPDFNQVNNTPIDSIVSNTGSFSNANGGFNPAMADIDNDGRAELLVGNPQGGVVLFKNFSLLSGVELNAPAENLVIFPNPSNGIFQLNYEANSIAAVRIYDLQGKLVMQVSTQEIDASNLNVGMYIVELTLTNGNVARAKLIRN